MSERPLQRVISRWLASWLACVPLWPLTTHAEDTLPTSLRLYVIDCGTLEFSDMAHFSDSGEYDGRPGKLVDPCYLVRHPKGDLLWDTGLPPPSDATDEEGMKVTHPVPLTKQLERIGLAPADIEFIAFSHMHFDHAGGANNFPDSTWLLNKRELEWATASETVAAGMTDPTTFSAYRAAKKQLFEGDFDVFGDGSVRILRAPGHTPGHQLLMLSFRKAGKLLLGGDLYHTKENERAKRVPAFNVSRADTLASFDRAIRLVRAKRARFIVQHSTEDFASLPAFPGYLE